MRLLLNMGMSHSNAMTPKKENGRDEPPPPPFSPTMVDGALADSSLATVSSPIS